MRSSPLQQVLERFEAEAGGKRGKKAEAAGDGRRAAKQALVKAVQALAKKGDILRESFSEKGAERASNRQLLRLLDLAEKVREQFGTRTALVDRIMELENRVKDAGYKTHLERLRLATLYDRYQSALKRTQRRAKKAAS